MRIISAAALALTAITLALPGCAGHQHTPDTDTLYVPASSVSLATIRRHTMYALTRSPTTDTLVLEESGDSRQPGSRLTWLVQIPTDIPVGATLRFGADDERVEAWLLEHRGGEKTHGVRVEGSIKVNARNERGVDATVVLRAPTREPGPGEAGPWDVTTTRRALWVYDTPGGSVTPELDDTGG